jgi:hypothetical protein
MMAIQAMDAKTKNLAQEIDNAVDPELSDLEEEILAFSKAQMELKKAYLERQQESDNLPPYEELVDNN